MMKKRLLLRITLCVLALGLGLPGKAQCKAVNTSFKGGEKLTYEMFFNWKFVWSGRVNLKPEECPKTFDWDMWLGPAPWKPYNRHRTHGTFRGYWDYDSGGLGDMAQHYLDPLQYLLCKDETSPVKVEYKGPKQHPDVVGRFDRITLVNKGKTERLTIDFNIGFMNKENQHSHGTDQLVIIELKRDGNVFSPITNLLRDIHVHPTGFSKCCIGMALTDPSLKQNAFKPKLRNLEKINGRPFIDHNL